MKLTGKYKVEITDKNGNKRFYETKNQIVNKGIRQVLDWLSFDFYNHNSFQGLKKLSRDEMYFPSNQLDTANSMYYYESVLDYPEKEQSDYFYDENDPVDLDNTHYFKNNQSKDSTFATIDNYRDGKQSITICFEDGAIMLAAINLDAEMFYPKTTNEIEKNIEPLSFEIEYREINDVIWKKLPCNYTLINDGIRRNITFFVCQNVPPFVFIPCTALKFSFNVNADKIFEENQKKELEKFQKNMIAKIYNISLFKTHTIPQPPAVMKFGSGNTQVSEEQTNLEKFEYSQVVTYTKKNANTVSYIVEIPKEKCNDVDISEVGMFYRYDNVNPTQQHIHQSVKNANTMFSRALFTDENGNVISWKKTSDEEIQISYDVTVSNG